MNANNTIMVSKKHRGIKMYENMKDGRYGLIATVVATIPVVVKATITTLNKQK